MGVASYEKNCSTIESMIYPTSISNIFLGAIDKYLFFFVNDISSIEGKWHPWLFNCFFQQVYICMHLPYSKFVMVYGLWLNL